MQLGLFAINVHDLTGCDVAKLRATYCADTISTSSRTRKPYRFNGYEWVTVGAACKGRMVLRVSAFRLVPLEGFDGPTHRYNDPHPAGQRLDYHGMLVTCEGKQRVMCGPEITLEGTEEVPLCIEPETAWSAASAAEGDEDEEGDYDDEGYGDHYCTHGVSYDEFCEECLEENEDGDEEETEVYQPGHDHHSAIA